MRTKSGSAFVKKVSKNMESISNEMVRLSHKFLNEKNHKMKIAIAGQFEGFEALYHKEQKWINLAVRMEELAKVGEAP